MKNKLLLLIFPISLLVLIIIFLVFNIKYPYKENEIYNQNDIPGYSENKDGSSNLISRNEAIKIATHILKDVLDVNLDREKFQIYVNVYKGGINNDDYNWNISWYRNDLNENYGVEINSNTGVINYIYINKVTNYNDKIDLLGEEEIKGLVDNLTGALNLDLNAYNMSMKSISDYNINRGKTVYKVCTFINKTDSSDKFVISIDCKGKFINSYRRKPS